MTNLSLIAGESFTQDLNVELDGSYYDCTGKTVYVYIKPSSDTTEANATITKTITSFSEGPTSGVDSLFTLALSTTETALLTKKVYYYTVKVTGTNFVRYDDNNINALVTSNPQRNEGPAGYVTPSEVRDMCSISSTQLSDSQLWRTIKYASEQLNKDLQVQVFKEKIEYIDDMKTNDIDDSNTTFFLKNSNEGQFIGDYNNDFTITVADLEVWSEADETRTALTVSSVTHNRGSFVLSTAPSNDKDYYVNYVWSMADMSTPSALVKMACAQLAAAWGFSKLNVGKADRFHLGNMTVFRDTDAHMYWMSEYRNTLQKISAEYMMQTVDSTKPEYGR